MVDRALVLGTFLVAACGVLGEPSELSPLESFFSESSRFGEQISPDGRQVAYLSPDNRGCNCLWVVSLEDILHPRRISNGIDPSVTCYFWTRDCGVIWQTSGTDGRPGFHVYYPVTKEVKEIHIALTGIISLQGICDSEKGPVLLFGASQAPTSFPDLYPLEIGAERRPELIFPNRDRIILWVFDSSGKPTSGLRWNSNGSKEILDLRKEAARVVFHVEGGEDLRLLSSSSDGTRAFLLTNKGSDLTRLVSLDLATAESITSAQDPLGRVDVGNVVFDSTSSELLVASYVDETSRWSSALLEFSEVTSALSGKVPCSDITSIQASADYKHWLLRRSSSREPGVVWLYDSDSRTIKKLWKENADLDRSALSETKAISYTAGDGISIPAFLTKPRIGKAPWPLVIFPHGGPHMRTMPGYDGRVQFLASRGYAVLQPNFRGSRGYGKRFMNAGDGQWGTGLMQSDLSDGVEEMLRMGITTKDRIAIFGGSYGGYAALAGMTFTPDLYAAGISLFGISDLNSYVSQVPSEWEPYAGDLVRQLGDPSTSAGKAALTAMSPLHHASAVRAPLLIYHARKDNLIPIAQSEAMVAALRHAGKAVTFLTASDEGHGFSRPESEMAVYRSVELFLHEHLGGRVGGDPGQAVRLKWKALHEVGSVDH